MNSILKFMLVLVAVLMTFFILLQEGKGGGLAALGGTKAAAVEGVTNPIRRATAWLAVIFFLLAILLGILNRAPTSLYVGEKPAPGSETEANDIDAPPVDNAPNNPWPPSPPKE